MGMSSSRSWRSSEQPSTPASKSSTTRSSPATARHMSRTMVVALAESNQIKEKPTQSPCCRLTIWTGMLLLSAVIRGGRCIIAGDCDADRAGSEIDVHDPDAEIWVTRDVQRSSGVVDR
ncbi:Os11g0464800 [Oryza sativa Japonica Group]|uniref:Os11g0464800 protein n=1 Tax=Oryza sativa subsp. japonica TaxID=39947 RepID=A0A0P0Y245_ORYSJ|nr:Os11g0464800 [Oryza sativa Japonica Group]